MVYYDIRLFLAEQNKKEKCTKLTKTRCLLRHCRLGPARSLSSGTDVTMHFVRDTLHCGDGIVTTLQISWEPWIANTASRSGVTFREAVISRWYIRSVDGNFDRKSVARRLHIVSRKARKMPSLSSLLPILALSTQTLAGLTRRQNAPTAPTAHVRNGTLTGYHQPNYDQDYFLGIPFAQPPVGDLRFRPPMPLNETWSGSRNATEYSPQCIGYGMDTWSQGNYISEDCLTLNVIRSTGSGNGLPVLV